jgi:hypothetical protein
MSSLKPGTVDLRLVFRAVSGRDLNRGFRSNFETRLFFQKAMYLLQVARAVKPSMRFGLHLYGPYSSSWAKKGYEVSDGEHCAVDVTDRFGVVENLLKGRSTSEVVALATLHFYHERLGLSRAKARAKAESDGKVTVLKHFDGAWSQLDTANWLA